MSYKIILDSCGELPQDLKCDKRFERVYTQSMGSMEIWVDKETGVNYLWTASGYAGGLTVLVNRDGSPVVTPVPYEEE